MVPLEETHDQQEFRYQADAWEDPIGDWLTGRSEVTTSQIMLDCLGIDLARQDRSAQTRVGNILRRLGWEQIQIRRGHRRYRVYRPPVTTSEVVTGCDKVMTSSTGGLCHNVTTKIEQKISIGFLPSNSTKQKTHTEVVTGCDNPILEPLSQPVTTSVTTPHDEEVVTNRWEEIE